MICQASLDPKLGSGMVGIKGALVAYNDLAQVTARHLAAELTADKAAKTELETTVSRSAKQDNSASSMMSVGM